MPKLSLTASTALGASLALSAVAQAQTTLTIESWRSDDIATWQEVIIPAFEATHPEISVTFSPTAPTEYNSALGARLDAGSAGDLIACRPFDASLALFQRGQLADLSDLPGLENFSAIARTAWSTDDGSQTFCVPMASVLHGFMYNETAFEELGIQPPATEEEFFQVLQTIQDDGTYVPLAMGTLDQWEAATMGYQNIGPAYWQGEEGREALVAGTQQLTDPDWERPLETLARWRPFLGEGFEAQSYADSQNFFTLGRAAIYPAGSWEIATFEAQADFPIGAFPPPVLEAGGTCFVSDHPDIAMGLNAASPNAEAARTFLEWVASPEFATLYANAAPGFFPLIDTPIELENELASEIVGWRETCEPTIRSTYQILSRGTPNLENETWTASANVINGTEEPAAAAARLQEGLDSWYTPGEATEAAPAE